MLGHGMRYLMLVCGWLFAVGTVAAQDTAPPLQVRWEHPVYYAQAGDALTIVTRVSNVSSAPITNIVLTLNLPPSIDLQFETLFSEVGTIEQLNPGETFNLRWNIVTSTDGRYTVQADVEAADLFFVSLTDVVVAQRSPALGYYDAGQFVLIDGLGQGEVLAELPFGTATARPLVGDWNGDGYTGIGTYDNNRFRLRENTAIAPDAEQALAPDVVVNFTELENPIPLVGDWNGNGSDSIMLYQDGFFYLRYFLSSGIPDAVIEFGPRDDPDVLPLAGDWDGDGIDTIGFYVDGTFFLRNENSDGFADVVFDYGPLTGARPLVGDWNGDGIDTIGLIIGRELHINDQLDGSPAEAIIPLDESYLAPAVLVGYWLGADDE